MSCCVSEHIFKHVSELKPIRSLRYVALTIILTASSSLFYSYETSAQARKSIVTETSKDPWLDQFLKTAQRAPNKRARRAIKTILAAPERYRFQALITEYTRGKAGEITLIPHRFRVDAEYLYPASAIKTFGSLAALRYFTELRARHPWLTLDDPIAFHEHRCTYPESSNTATQLLSLEHLIKETQLISSNRAFNRVFNITGARGIHERVIPDFPSVRVFHRLSSSETARESLKTPPLSVCDQREGTVNHKRAWSRRGFTSQAELSDLEAAPAPHAFTGFGNNHASLKVGVAHIHMKTKRRVEAPMNFTSKNRVSLYDFQRLAIGIIQPSLDTPFGPKIQLFQAQRSHTPSGSIRATWLDKLRHAMAIYPHNSHNPKYTHASLSETRFKPMIRGVRWADKRSLTDTRLYYLNKAGKALGFHMDNAFIGYASGPGEISSRGYHTRRLKRGLFITVGLYVNQDQTLNDNRYEYKQLSAPALNAIGYAAGRYLLNRLKHD